MSIDMNLEIGYNDMLRGKVFACQRMGVGAIARIFRGFPTDVGVSTRVRKNG